MTVTINRIRMSSIRALSLPATFEATTGPGPLIGTVTGYFDAFASAGQPNALWRLPWTTDPASRLWKRILNRKDLSLVDAKRAWSNLMPLWSAPSDPVTAENGTEVTVDRYLFPGAVSIVISLTLTGSLTPQAALDAATAARQANIYRPAPGQPPVGIAELHDFLLAACQHELLGALDPNACGDQDPLSIVSITSATGSSEDAVIEQDNPMHRLLYGLCAFDDDALDNPVPNGASLATSRLTQSERSHGGTLLAFHRGRACWSPAKMFDPSGQFQLTRYHDHLAVSSAITEAFLALVTDDHAISATQPGVDIARLVAKRLGMLYGPAPDIWSSTSIRRQIDESHQRDKINQLRLDNGWSPLKARIPAP